MIVVRIVLALIRGIVADRAELAAENLALRQQLAIVVEQKKRPRLRKRDRVFWAILSRVWPNWRSALLIVQPDTVSRGVRLRARPDLRASDKSIRVKELLRIADCFVFYPVSLS